jgi:hypothetical protein
MQIFLVLKSGTESARVTRQARSLRYFSLLFNFITVFKKNTEFVSTYMKLPINVLHNKI